MYVEKEYKRNEKFKAGGVVLREANLLVSPIKIQPQAIKSLQIVQYNFQNTSIHPPKDYIYSLTAIKIPCILKGK